MLDDDTWRQERGPNAKRMSWWRELRWLLAAKLILWAMNLMLDEMSSDTAKAFAHLGNVMKNDTRFDTVPMQPIRKAK